MYLTFFSLILYNSWQKREIRPAGREKEYSRPSTKRKQENPRSPSPALTSYSRRSHPRSRSRSASPRGGRRWNEGKRDRRESSPPRTRDVSEPGYTSAWTYSPSTPLPPRVVEDTRGRPRRPSTSSRSTKSRSRSSGSGSVSDSPESRKKAKHRLPTATSLLDIELQAKSLTRLTVSQKNEINASRNGKSGKAARKAERRAVRVNLIFVYEFYSDVRVRLQSKPKVQALSQIDPKSLAKQCFLHPSQLPPATQTAYR